MKKFIPYLLIASFVIGLVFVPKASAATISPSFIGLNSVYLDLIETSFAGVDSTDNPLGNYVIATYKGYHSSKLSFSGTDGYTSGFSTVSMDFSVITPSGSTNNGTIVSNSPFNGTSYYVSSRITGSTPRTASLTCNIILDNIWDTNTIQITDCEILYTCYFPYTGSNTPDPAASVSCTISAQVSGNLTKMPEPQDMGYAHIISSAINNGDFNTDLGNMVDLLTLIKDNNSTYYTNILSSLNTSAEWLQEIFTMLEGWENDEWDNLIYSQQLGTARLGTLLTDLATYNTSFYTNYGNRVLHLLGKLADMSATEQTQAAAMQSEYAAISAKADEQAAQMNPPKPTFSANQFDMNTNVDSTQRGNFVGLIGMILGNSFFVRMMLIILTCAIAGFALYGRKNS